MTVPEARRTADSFYAKSNPSEEDIFIFTEAMTFLIEKTHNPRYMLELGGFYYEAQRFELALKYYELAAEYKVEEAYNCLGYIWYYGRTGTRDYEKAFKYYSLAAEAGNVQAAYKVADMYKNGYFVEKDYAEYVRIIEELYPKVKNARYTNEPLPEIATRLARIRAEQGRTDEAVELYTEAKEFQAVRLKYTDFFGDLNIMKWLIDDLYKLIEFDRSDFDFYDMYYLLTAPCEISFSRGRSRYTVKAVAEDDGLAIEFGGKWFRSREDFFAKASIGSKKLIEISDELYDFEVK